MMSDSTVSNYASTNSLTAEAAPMVVRPSRDDDVNAMLDIYRRHIVRGVEPAFAHDPETLQPDDIKRRRRNMRKHRLPHLVADRGGVVVAYAYAVLFRKRPAYRYAVKHSIYGIPIICTPASAARCCRP
jgi:phosphinothricin acetyltransferase